MSRLSPLGGGSGSGGGAEPPSDSWRLRLAAEETPPPGEMGRKATSGPDSSESGSRGNVPSGGDDRLCDGGARSASPSVSVLGQRQC